MVGWYEYVGEQTDPKPIGRVRLNTFYETRKKPLWLILVKMVGMLVMCLLGIAMLLPLIPLPLWQSLALVGGGILIYVGIAFFVRPEPNGDNMGWLGGFFNDPTHYSDNVNRALFSAHCLLGPGRFICETILDVCTLLGWTPEVTAEEHQVEEEAKDQAALYRELEALRERVQERLEQRQNGFPGGQVELQSARHLESHSVQP
jgi:hypothetical protein